MDTQLFVDDVLADCGIAKPTIQVAPDPVTWIEQNFYLYDTEQLITFHERQRRPLAEALRTENGFYVYNTVLWSWPKKSAKSCVIAAVALYVMCHKPHASVKLIANDLKQADSRVGYYLREAIKIAQKKGHNLGNFKITPSGYHIENLSNGARCEMIPIDPSGEAGANDDLLVYSELHGWKSTAHQRMWSEMTLSPNKFGNSQRWIDTYSGFVGESPILENLYQMSVQENHRLWSDWEIYVHPTAKIFCVWVTQHHLPWQTDERGRAYYAEQSTTLTPNEFRRVHGNEWVSSVQQFVPIEWWDACKVAELPINRHNEIVVGIDAAVDNDCFGIIALSRHGDKTAVRYARKWTPPQGGKLEFANYNNKDDIEYPMGELRRLAREFNVICFAFDPYQLESFASQCRNDGLGLFEAFGQVQPRLIADKKLYDGIRDRMIMHTGEPDLRQHIMNANSTAEDKDTLRIVKRSPALKIDLAVALSMANDVAYTYLPG